MNETFTSGELSEAAKGMLHRGNAERVIAAMVDSTAPEPWTRSAIRSVASSLRLLSVAQSMMAAAVKNRAAQDGIMLSVAELRAAIGRVVAGYTLKDHIHPAMVDPDGLCGQIVRDVINHREPVWEDGVVIRDKDGKGDFWRRHDVDGESGWYAFGNDFLYADDVPARPLREVSVS